LGIRYPTRLIVIAIYHGAKGCLDIFCHYDFGMDKSKPRMGRPPKAPGEAKGLVYQLRLTEAEREDYERAAEQAGMPLAAWMRSCLTRAAKRTPKA
jgi:hypothetical protein